MRATEVQRYANRMPIDVCTVSTATWLLFGAVFGGIGCLIGIANFIALRNKAPDLSTVSGPNFLGGCLLPFIIALIVAYAASRLLPDDPCNGAFTADTPLIPLYAFAVIAFCGAMTFWIAASRRR